MSEAPRYLVTEKSYIGLGIVEAGGEVEYHGEPGAALEPLNAAAKAAKAAAADKPVNPTQYLIDAPDLVLKPYHGGRKAAAPAKTDRDPAGQGTIRDPGGADPAMPFDPATGTTDTSTVHLPKPAEDDKTPGREKAQTAAQKKAAEAQARARDLT